MQDRHKIKLAELVCDNMTNINQPPVYRPKVFAPHRGLNASGEYWHPQGPGIGEVSSNLWTGLILVILCIIGGIFYAAAGAIIWAIKYFARNKLKRP